MTGPLSSRRAGCAMKSAFPPGAISLAAPVRGSRGVPAERRRQRRADRHQPLGCPGRRRYQRGRTVRLLVRHPGRRGGRAGHRHSAHRLRQGGRCPLPVRRRRRPGGRPRRWARPAARDGHRLGVRRGLAGRHRQLSRALLGGRGFGARPHGGGRRHQHRPRAPGQGHGCPQLPRWPQDHGDRRGSPAHARLQLGRGQAGGGHPGCHLVVPVTYTPTAGAAATCALALSPDNLTYSTLVTVTVPLGTALDSFVDQVAVAVPAGWWVRLTVANATLGTGTWY